MAQDATGPNGRDGTGASGISLLTSLIGLPWRDTAQEGGDSLSPFLSCSAAETVNVNFGNTEIPTTAPGTKLKFHRNVSSRSADGNAKSSFNEPVDSSDFLHGVLVYVRQSLQGANVVHEQPAKQSRW